MSVVRVIQHHGEVLEVEPVHAAGRHGRRWDEGLQGEPDVLYLEVADESGEGGCENIGNIEDSLA